LARVGREERFMKRKAVAASRAADGTGTERRPRPMLARK
jgi:hypothetical protein